MRSVGSREVQSRSKQGMTAKRVVGHASFYAKRFAGRQMADGAKMKPQGSNAASKTLPLGTTATVTNIETGQCAVLTGLAKVQVAPIASCCLTATRNPVCGARRETGQADLWRSGK
jgi:hypothetical protein